MKKTSRHTVYVVLMLLVSVACISVFFTGGDPDAMVYEKGHPWNYPKLRAPFEIPIPYDSVSAQVITDSIKAKFVPFFVEDTAVQTSQISALTTSLEPIDSEPKRKLIAATKMLYEQGIVSNATRDSIAAGKLDKIILLDGTQMNTVTTEEYMSVREAYSKLDSIMKAANHQSIVTQAQMSKFLTPNVVCDTAKTNEDLDGKLKTALAPYGIVLTGETIIDNGDIVTEQKYALIKEYERMSSDLKLSTAGEQYDDILSRVFMASLLLLVFYLYMGVMEHDTFVQTKKMLFLTFAIMLFVIIVCAVARYRQVLVFAIPFALVPIMVSLFTNNRIAVMSLITMLLLCSLVVAEPSDFITMQFTACIIALLSVKGLTQRSQLVKAAFFIFLSYSLTYIAQHIIKHGSIDNIDWYVYVYIAFNAIVLSFAYFIIFIIEKLFGFTSQVTLVELADINNRALRELSQVCPGTFQHSLQVANLAGEAALRIGANVQLARTGALYHDIGKTENPAFFTENQRSVNPHDALQPEQSAAIIIQHVTDGVQKAAKAKLPQVVKDFITQHHGRGIVKFFYNKASKNGSSEPNKADFSYPGPNPQSRETAIVMMADACEAACKSLSSPDEKNIEALVKRIIDSQMAEGLLQESPISFKEINTVKECLIEMLNTIYHTRVSYPDEVKPNSQALEDAQSNDDEQ